MASSAIKRLLKLFRLFAGTSPKRVGQQENDDKNVETKQLSPTSTSDNHSSDNTSNIGLEQRGVDNHHHQVASEIANSTEPNQNQETSQSQQDNNNNKHNLLSDQANEDLSPSTPSFILTQQSGSSHPDPAITSVDDKQYLSKSNKTHRHQQIQVLKSNDKGHSNHHQHHYQNNNNNNNHNKQLKPKPFIDPNLLLTASDYKIVGNKLCSLSRYDEAIGYYNKAISKSPDVAIFYSNRALCHVKLQQWSQAIQDCRRALELEANSIKAHFFLGQALAELNNHDDALKHLHRAHELAKEEKLNFGDDIAYHIRLVKRRRWSKVEEESAQLEDELQIYLINLINKDRQDKLNQLKGNRLVVEPSPQSSSNFPNASSSSNWQPIPSSSSVKDPIVQTRTTLPHAIGDDDDDNDNNDNRNQKHRKSDHAIQKQDNDNFDDDEEVKKNEELIIHERCDNYVGKLEAMFNDLKLRRKKREVPDYLCGKISFEIMQDPVITPSGITYDRQDIEEHLRRVGHFDPITRQPLKASQLISNLAMKEVVDAYLNENEWALYY